MERITAPASPAVGLGEQVRVVARLAGRLRGFVRGQLGPPDNPYHRLFAHAGIGLAEVRRSLTQHGLEGTLGTLSDAGVDLSLDQFKGRRPVRGGSLEFETAPHDFDNPLSSRDIDQQTGGSPLDCQLVEAESDDTGLPQVVVVASPRIGPLDEPEIAGAVVGFLDHLPSSGGTFGRRWQEAGTLRLERRDPTATGAGKMLALHVSGRNKAQTSNPAA